MRSSRKVALALVVGVVVVQAATMPKERMPGDAMVPRTAARALVFAGTLEVSSLIGANASSYVGHFPRNPETGGLYSNWGVTNTLLFVPPTLAYRALKGRVALSNNTLFLLCLNVNNIVLSVLIALLLFALAGIYTERLALRIGFTLVAIYGSYTWYYLRAQSIDLFHLALFLGYAYAVLRFHGRAHWLTLLGAAALLSLLIHARSAFGLFLPAFCLSLYLSAKKYQISPRQLLKLIAPAAALLFVALVGLALLNKYKFGSYWATGYHDSLEMARTSFFERSMLSNLYVHLFDLQRGLFVHFPLAILGVAMAPRFYRAHRRDALFIIAHVVPYLILLSIISHIGHGEWAYGPRLLLPFAPLLALPAYLLFADSLSAARKKVLAYCIIAVATFSFTYQLKVISRPFQGYYLLDQLFARHSHPHYRYRLSRFFSRTHVGEVYDSVLAFAEGESTNKALELIRLYNPTVVPQLRQALERDHFKLNFFFF